MVAHHCVDLGQVFEPESERLVSTLTYHLHAQFALSDGVVRTAQPRVGNPQRTTYRA